MQTHLTLAQIKQLKEGAEIWVLSNDKAVVLTVKSVAEQGLCVYFGQSSRFISFNGYGEKWKAFDNADAAKAEMSVILHIKEKDYRIKHPQICVSSNGCTGADSMSVSFTISKEMLNNLKKRIVSKSEKIVDQDEECPFGGVQMVTRNWVNMCFNDFFKELEK